MTPIQAVRRRTLLPVRLARSTAEAAPLLGLGQLFGENAPVVLLELADSGQAGPMGEFFRAVSASHAL